MQLQIEPVAHCNAACVFCPYPTMTRKRGVMDMDLFRKIIDEAATHRRIDHYTLTGLGETLLDRFLVERIQYIRKKVKYAGIDLYTNGSIMTPARVDALRDAGLNVIYVSLNAVRAEQRKAIMRVDDFDKVCGYIDYAIDKGHPMKVIVKALISKDLFEDGDQQAFFDRWGGPYNLPGGHAFTHLEGNWSGEMWKVRTKPTKACARALDEVMVLWDGRVSLCCFDGEGDVIFGDLRTQTIREVFDGEKAYSYRKAHIDGRRGELKLCSTCTAI